MSLTSGVALQTQVNIGYSIHKTLVGCHLNWSFLSCCYVYQIEFPSSKSTLQPLPYILSSVVLSCVCLFSFWSSHQFHQFPLKEVIWTSSCPAFLRKVSHQCFPLFVLLAILFIIILSVSKIGMAAHQENLNWKEMCDMQML